MVKDPFWDTEIDLMTADGHMETITNRQYHEMCAAVKKLEAANKELVTLRFWREQGLHELKRLKDEMKEIRERLVEQQTKMEVLKTAIDHVACVCGEMPILEKAMEEIEGT